jgi:hypothetical protein
MTEREMIYNRLCRVLTEYESGEATTDELYTMLVEIQNGWETVITTSK